MFCLVVVGVVTLQPIFFGTSTVAVVSFGVAGSSRLFHRRSYTSGIVKDRCRCSQVRLPAPKNNSALPVFRKDYIISSSEIIDNQDLPARSIFGLRSSVVLNTSNRPFLFASCTEVQGYAIVIMNGRRRPFVLTSDQDFNIRPISLCVLCCFINIKAPKPPVCYLKYMSSRHRKRIDFSSKLELSLPA